MKKVAFSQVFNIALKMPVLDSICSPSAVLHQKSQKVHKFWNSPLGGESCKKTNLLAKYLYYISKMALFQQQLLETLSRFW